jgi:hypothetical protein
VSRPGEGPFTAGKCMVVDDANYDGAAVFSADGQPFCFVTDDIAVGGRAGATARATRIAEMLNRQEGHGKPAPYLDEQGNLRAPEGYGFVVRGDGCEMVPLINVTMAPAP